jgi:hypothetical protein
MKTINEIMMVEDFVYYENLIDTMSQELKDKLKNIDKHTLISVKINIPENIEVVAVDVVTEDFVKKEVW